MKIHACHVSCVWRTMMSYSVVGVVDEGKQESWEALEKRTKSWYSVVG